MRLFLILITIFFSAQVFAEESSNCTINNKEICKEAESLVDKIYIFLNQPDMNQPNIKVENNFIEISYKVDYQPDQMPEQDILNFADKLESDFCKVNPINDFIYNGGKLKYVLVGPNGTGIGVTINCNIG